MASISWNLFGFIVTLIVCLGSIAAGNRWFDAQLETSLVLQAIFLVTSFSSVYFGLALYLARSEWLNKTGGE